MPSLNIKTFLLFTLTTTLTIQISAAEPKPTDWTGVYAGVVGGHSWGEANTQFSPSPLLAQPIINEFFLPGAYQTLQNTGSQNYGMNGFLGGMELGYNHQINHLVLGVEADFQYTDLGKRQSKIGTLNFNPLITTSINLPTEFNGQVRSDWLSTVRSRIGYAEGNLLGFISGGLAIADYSYTSARTLNVSNGITTNPISSASRTTNQILTGWTVGAGAEYAFLDNWSIKAEYLYARFDNIGDNSSTMDNLPLEAVSKTSAFTQHIARMGINYHF